MNINQPLCNLSINEKYSTYEDVFNYWFGGDIKVNYKTKWFPTGNIQLQEQADLDITNKFGDLFYKAVSNDVEILQWKNETRSCIAYVILLDQFSRHIYRYQGLASNAIERKHADSLALSAIESLTSRLTNWDENLSVSEFVFGLMPFRHSATSKRLENVMKLINQRQERESNGIDLLTKFRKQTLRRLQHLQDRDKAAISDDILERLEFQADETNILQHTVVKSTELFLRKQYEIYKSLREETINEIKMPVTISLSGGVDSMVIAKALCILKEKLLFLGDIHALHIDYANRDESKAEAAFVEDWCYRNGLLFNKKIVNEVTRGITDRTEYEKVSRLIRYKFYEDNLAISGCSAVIFGHHKGDVQENVISNVMRGCSAFAMSGMTEVGISNNVTVWRPLLGHPKDDIFDFAHTYGTPYFKDTTPTWSTRGKLRNILVPLLIDMYGVGCLNNLSSLALESDLANELVQTNIFEPFNSKIKRFKCGLSVNILPYKDQPVLFWKEVLKEMMHSMSMSMIREKAVGNFVERLQRPQSTWVSGWLELRKDFNTLLEDNGNLLVLKDGVLKPIVDHIRGGSNSDAKNINSRIQKKIWDKGFQLQIEDIVNGRIINLGPWEITIEKSILQPISDEHSACIESLKVNSKGKVMGKALTSVQEIMEGIFSYQLLAPLRCLELRVYLDSLEFTKSEASKLKIFPVCGLIPLDDRLKFGLPLLVPVEILSSNHIEMKQKPYDEYKNIDIHRINLKYRYI